MRFHCLIAGAALAVAAAAVSGCQSLVFAVANRGLEAPTATVVYAADRGLSLDIYRPATATSATPVVVFFYGGSWQTGQREDYRFVGRRLAGEGILAVVADYRLWPRAGFPGFVEDGAQAVAWTREHAAAYGGDPRRLFVAGHSAGAQIAALIGADPRWLAPHGMQPRDLAGVIGLSGPYDFHIGPDLAPIFGPPAQWPLAQAVGQVDGDEPPFLLVHGDADTTVGAAQSRELARRLSAQHEPVSLVILPSGGHLATIAALYDPSRNPEVLTSIRRFVDAPRAAR
ncbi:alpha/beta hydrolase [Lysobacter sp. HA35]